MARRIVGAHAITSTDVYADEPVVVDGEISGASSGRAILMIMDHEELKNPVVICHQTVEGALPDLLDCTIRPANGHPLAVFKGDQVVAYLGIVTISFKPIYREN